MRVRVLIRFLQKTSVKFPEIFWRRNTLWWGGISSWFVNAFEIRSKEGENCQFYPEHGGVEHESRDKRRRGRGLCSGWVGGPGKDGEHTAGRILSDNVHVGGAQKSSMVDKGRKVYKLTS